MRTEEEIQEEIERIVNDIVKEEKENHPLRVAGLFRMAMALQWVLN